MVIARNLKIRAIIFVIVYLIFFLISKNYFTSEIKNSNLIFLLVYILFSIISFFYFTKLVKNFFLKVLLFLLPFFFIPSLILINSMAEKKK